MGVGLPGKPGHHILDSLHYCSVVPQYTLRVEAPADLDVPGREDIPPRWFLNQQPQDRRLNATPARWQTRQQRIGGTQASRPAGPRRASSCKAGNLITQKIVSRCDRASHLTDGRRNLATLCSRAAQDIGTSTVACRMSSCNSRGWKKSGGRALESSAWFFVPP